MWAAALLTVVGVYLVHVGMADARRREGGAGQGPAGGRLPRRPRLGPAGAGGAAQPADVAGAVLLDRGSARRRGLVLVDAVDGEVVEHLVEDNPERWSAAPPAPTPPDRVARRHRSSRGLCGARAASAGRPSSAAAGCGAARRRPRGPRAQRVERGVVPLVGRRRSMARGHGVGVGRRAERRRRRPRRGPAARRRGRRAAPGSASPMASRWRRASERNVTARSAGVEALMATSLSPATRRADPTR